MDMDKEAFKRILNNLIQNVFTHSHATQIKISAIKDDAHIAFFIQDNGVGIPEKDLPHIFERLYKCNTARGVNGNGLGLSIVKELLKGLQGEINVQSVKGNGTEFEITFPISASKKDR